MENIDQKEVDDFNEKLAKLLAKTQFSLGSEVYIQDGLVKSKVVIVPKAKAISDKKPKSKDEKDTA